jgi:dTMP kinase
MQNPIKIPNGFFVVLEGIDGSGKTTVGKLIEDKLSLFFQVLLTKEPSDSIYGKKLREAFEKKRLSPDEELDLFVKDRELHIEEVVKPYLKKEYIVITDRYFFSNIAYQGAYGVPVEKVKERNSHFPLPDMVLYFDIDIDTAISRINKARGNANKVETKENISEVESIYSTIEKEYNIFHRIDANQKIENVANQSINAILNNLITKYNNDNNLIKDITDIRAKLSFGENQ